VILDKGQRDDWFESNFITMLCVVCVASLVFVIWWEWRHKDPIIDLHLFSQRTFAAANFLMFMLGFVLLGSTLLLPLFMQTLLGYTAERAGMALTPGGLVIMAILPFVGFLLSRYDARRLMVVGLTALSLALFHMTTFDLQIDFHTAMMARIYQAAGLAFLFVPINTAAYAYLPREKNNAASGLMNLARNIGGSVGISFVTTMLERRQQFHMVQMAAHLSEANPALNQRLSGLAGVIGSHGGGSGDAITRAYAMVQSIVGQQANMLAYIDCFWLLAVSSLIMIPLVFVMKKTRPGSGMAAH